MFSESRFQALTVYSTTANAGTINPGVQSLYQRRLLTSYPNLKAPVRERL
jgi:hypothetical protein